MSKANVVYEGASPGGEDAKGIALWDPWANPRDSDGTWICQVCLDESSQGVGNELGATTCAYHPYNCAELQCINRLCYQAQKSSQMSDKVKDHMEFVLSTAKDQLMEAAQRSALIPYYNPEDNIWSLADDANAAAITAAGSSHGVTQDTPVVDSYDNPVVQGKVFNRLWHMSSPNTPNHSTIQQNATTALAKKMCGVGDEATDEATACKWSAQFWRDYIDKFVYDWGRSTAAVAIFDDQWVKVLNMPDQGFASTLLSMNNLSGEPTDRYVIKMTNVWSRLFGIQRLPIAAHQRAKEYLRQLKHTKNEAKLEKRAREDEKVAAAAEFAKTLRANETRDNMYLASTGLHSPSLKPHVVCHLQ
jgi:hypothetical protein